MEAGDIFMLESLPNTATAFEKLNSGLGRYSQDNMVKAIPFPRLLLSLGS